MQLRARTGTWDVIKGNGNWKKWSARRWNICAGLEERGSYTRSTMHFVMVLRREPVCELFERWEQHYNEHLNGAAIAGQEGEDNGRNVYVGTIDEGNQPVHSLKVVKISIHQLKNN